MISLHVLSEHADVQSEALELHWPAHPHRCRSCLWYSLTWSMLDILRWVRWVKDDFFACIIWTCWCAIRSSRITLTGSPALSLLGSLPVRKLWLALDKLHMFALLVISDVLSCFILSFFWIWGQRGMAWNCCKCSGVARKCCRRCQSAWWRPSPHFR